MHCPPHPIVPRLRTRFLSCDLSRRRISSNHSECPSVRLDGQSWLAGRLNQRHWLHWLVLSLSLSSTAPTLLDHFLTGSIHQLSMHHTHKLQHRPVTSKSYLTFDSIWSVLFSYRSFILKTKKLFSTLTSFSLSFAGVTFPRHSQSLRDLFSFGQSPARLPSNHWQSTY